MAATASGTPEVDDAGRCALVTGAGRGLGLEIALELARRGHRTVGTVRGSTGREQLIRAASEAGVHVEPAHLDVADPTSFRVPDDLWAVVNNAAINPGLAPLEAVEMDRIRAVFDVNFFGPAELTRRCIPRLRANGGGVICWITSLATLLPRPFASAYRTSKVAASALLESLTAELSGFGIRTVEIVAGRVESDMLERTDEPIREPYRELAAALVQRRTGGVRTSGPEPTSCGLDPNRAPTPRREAARRIVDAMEAPNCALRRGCDDVSMPVLAAWRALDDEAFRKDALTVLGVYEQR